MHVVDAANRSGWRRTQVGRRKRDWESPMVQIWGDAWKARICAFGAGLFADFLKEWKGCTAAASFVGRSPPGTSQAA